MTRATTKPDAWERLFAAALATGWLYQFAKGESWLADDVLSSSIEVESTAAGQLAGDRGEVTRERWARAALIVLEERLEGRTPKRLSPGMRRRFEGHVAKLRELLRGDLR